MRSLLERIKHIENFGTDYEYYRIYCNFENDVIVLNEKEFEALDKLYNGELAMLVIN